MWGDVVWCIREGSDNKCLHSVDGEGAIVSLHNYCSCNTN